MTSTHDDGREHLLVWEALPWIINGSATPQQRELVARHLPRCADCQAEHAHQQALRRAVSSAPAAAAPPDAEAGLAKLFARIDGAGAVDAAFDSSANATAPAPLEETLPRRRAAGGPLTYALAACVLVQAVGLGWMGSTLARRDAAQADYRTLSLPAPAGAGRAPMARVVPDAGMALSDWNALLHRHRLQVVEGPNQVGAYGLAPSAGAAPPADGWLERLRAAPGVRLAEPVGPVER